MKKRGPLAVDLFSGCGGLSLGLKRAGFEVLIAVELDPAAAASYRLNHRTTEVLERDIRNVNMRGELARYGLRPGDLDLLAACPPCQGFSSIRTRNGRTAAEDARNDLVLTLCEIVRTVQPRTLLLENVPGLARDFRFNHLLSELVALGYFYRADILDAANYGVPQHRRRLVLLASKTKMIPSAKPSRKTRSVADAIAALPKPSQSSDPLHAYAKRHSKKVRDLIKRIPARWRQSKCPSTKPAISLPQKNYGI